MSELLSYTQATHPGRDGLLDGRYQVLQTLSSGLWGQTYLAQDGRRPSQPECIIHRITPLEVHPEYQATFRHLFVREAATLEKLGEHRQIPQLLACFEEEQEFYLIQEFVDGYPLSYELNSKQPWSVEKVIQLLLGCLEPLAFVHQHCCRHGDLRPDTIVRRLDDDQLTLTNFGSVREIHLSLMTLNGYSSHSIVADDQSYQAPEQIQGLPCLASDVYSLGLIGIQALTGMHPSRFQKHPDTKELIWQPYCPASSSPQLHDLVAVLNEMTRYDCTQRYLSAKEALQALQLLAPNASDSNVLTDSAVHPEVADSVNPSADDRFHDHRFKDNLLNDDELDSLIDSDLSEHIDWDAFFQQENLHQESQHHESQPKQPQQENLQSNPPPELHQQKNFGSSLAVQAPVPSSSEADPSTKGFLTSPAMQLGVGLGAIVATAVCGYALPHLLDRTDRGNNTLEKATAQYQAGQFRQAIQLAESIPKNSSAYAPARSTITRWQKDWQVAETKYQAIETAFKQGKWGDVLQQSQGFPKISYWQQRLAPLIQEATAKAETEATARLNHAYSRAMEKDFTAALADLKQIAVGTSAYTKAQEKTQEYREKQQIRAVSLLQQAYDQAILQNFSEALVYLKQIPKNTSVYAKAQEKIKEYTEKQRIQTASANPVSPPEAKPTPNSTAVSIGQNINPGSYLREANLYS